MRLHHGIGGALIRRKHMIFPDDYRPGGEDSSARLPVPGRRRKNQYQSLIAPRLYTAQGRSWPVSRG